MQTPFPRISSAVPRLRIALLTKEDAPHTDTEVAALLGAERVAALQQVHGTRTIIVRESSVRTERADGLATDVPDLCLTIRSADCQTLLAVAPEHGVMGILHAGWKGMIAGAIPAFFAALHAEWGITGADLWIGLGPSLCQTCAAFTDPSRELPGIDSSYFDGRHVDLRGIADEQIASAGVRPDHIERHPACTRCHPEHYWTYRGGDREAVQGGRGNVLACVLERK